MSKTINRKEFLENIEKALPATTKTETTPQSDCVVFRDGFVWGYDDELCISHPIDIELEGAVKSNEIVGLFNKVKASEISLDSDENTLTTSWGKNKTAEFRIEENRLPLDEMGIPGDNEWQELPEDFCKAVDFVLFSAGSDLAKPLLTCVHVINTTVEACDGFRICRIQMQSDCEEMLIPAKLAKEIIKYNPVEYYVGDGWIYFINEENTVVCCKTFSETYPDLENLIPESGSEINLTGELDEVLDRASVFSARESRQNEVVEIEIANNEMTVEASNQAGTFSETIEIEEQTEIKFAINPDFIKDALKIVEKVSVCDNVLMFEGDDFVHVVCLMVT